MFTISADYMTQHARERARDFGWDEALRFLNASVPGLPLDNSVAILSGKQRFVQVDDDPNSVDLGDDSSDNQDTREYLAAMTRKYAGMLRLNGHFYQPYCEVVSFGPDDYKWAKDNRRQAGTTGSSLGYDSGSFKGGRALAYANDPGKDRALLVANGSRIVLFKPVGVPPLWSRNFINESEAVEDFEAVNALPTRGYHDPNAVMVDTEVLHEPRYREQAKLWLQRDGNVPQVVEALRRCNEMALDRERTERAIRDGFAADEAARQALEMSPAPAKRPLTAAELARNADLARKVQSKAAVAGYFELTVTDEGAEPRLLQVPKAPFLHWAFERVENLARFGLELPVWTPVSPSGVKLKGDSPMHSDWMLGTEGLDMVHDYGAGTAVQRAAWSEVSKWHAKVLKADCVVLSGEGAASGEVVFPQPGERVGKDQIAVIPHLDEDYLDALNSAAAVVAETGGKMSHLAILGRESKKHVVIQQGALSRYEEGDLLRLDLSARTIQIVGL